MSSSNITEYCACHAKWLSNISQKFLESSWNVIYNAGPIRAWSDHDPSMKPSVRNPPRNRGYFSSSPRRAFSIEKYNISRPGLHSKTHQVLHRPRKVTLELHQVLHLPHKITLMIDPDHWWNVIYNARSNMSQPQTSPNAAPATQNDSHDWSTSHMKRYLQCAEQHMSSSNITEYCACHAKWLSKISQKFRENSWNVIYNAGPIRPWSEHETVSPQPASQPRLLFELTTRIFCWKIQHFAPRLTFKNSPSAAPATKSNTWTSPSAAPATQNHCNDWSWSLMKRSLQCAE